MVGVDSERVETCLNIIREEIPAEELTDLAHARLTIYVLNLKEFSRV